MSRSAGDADADLFELIIGWADLAEAEIQDWPRTNGLGMTEQARSLLEEMAARPPVHEAPEPAMPTAPGPAGA